MLGLLCLQQGCNKLLLSLSSFLHTKFIFHLALTGTNRFFCKHDKYFHRILQTPRHTQSLLPVNHSFILYVPLKYRLKHTVMSKMEAKFISQCFSSNTIDFILCCLWLFFFLWHLYYFSIIFQMDIIFSKAHKSV